MTYLFVYGTLMEGMENYHIVEPFSVSVKKGLLKDISAYTYEVKKKENQK